MLDFDAIAGACRRHGVARLRIFGSALNDRFDPEASDILFAGGMTKRKLMVLFGVSETTIRRALARSKDPADCCSQRMTRSLQ